MTETASAGLASAPWTTDVPSGDARWLRPGLARRIMLGVSVGISLLTIVIGLLALTILNQTVDAAGREQVTVARTMAMEAAAALRALPPGATANVRITPRAPLLPSLAIPSDLHVQLVTSSGIVLEDNGHTAAGINAEHAILLHPLLVSDQAGFRIHNPGLGETFAPHVVAYAPIPGHPTLGVVIQQPQTSAVGAPYELIHWVIVVGILAVVLAIGAAWLDVHRVIGPLEILTTAAEHFAAGDLTVPVKIDRADEIGRLATSFEIMRQRLHQSLTEIETWNAKLERRVTQRTGELERRNQQLATINTIAEALSDSLDVTTLLDRTLDRIRDVTGFDVLAYRLATADQCLSLAADRGLPEMLNAEKIAIGECLCGRAAELKVCQFASDLHTLREAHACQCAGIASAIAVPLQSTDRVEGVLFLASRQPRRFESEDVDTLLAIGRQAGMAVANARLYATLQHRERERAQLLGQVIAAQEEERRRLANGLHDDVSQALALLLIGVESLAQTAGHSAQARDTVDDLRHLISSTLENIHALAAELRPSLLDDIGLVAALERLVEDVRRRSRRHVEFQTVNVEGLHLISAAETALFRIAQAALSNVVYHAEANVVSVLLQRRGDRLILMVEDDGKGFDLAKVRASPLKDRLGLAGIEERAQLIGASTTIESTLGGGTTIYVDLSVSTNVTVEMSDAEATGSVSR